MGPAQATKTCLMKSFQFKGRASRSEFWWFTPIALGMSTLLLWGIMPRFADLSFFMKWSLTICALCPLWAAGARRLQDTGEEGPDIFVPLGLFIGIPLAVFVVWIPLAMLNAFLAYLLAALIVLPTILFGLFTSFVSLGPTIGQLIVPSDRGPNRFGPNPNEVPS